MCAPNSIAINAIVWKSSLTLGINLYETLMSVHYFGNRQSMHKISWQSFQQLERWTHSTDRPSLQTVTMK